MPNRSAVVPVAFLVVPLLAMAVATGCGQEPVELVEAEGWTPVSAAEDPFADHRPDDIVCPSTSWGPEELGGELTLGVDTGACGYLTASRPSQAAIEAGDAIEVRAWHFALTATEPGEAHVAVRVGARTLWEERVTIPADSRLYAPVVEVPADAEAGTPVYFHVHNHGDNAWNLIGLTLHPEDG